MVISRWQVVTASVLSILIVAVGGCLGQDQAKVPPNIHRDPFPSSGIQGPVLQESPWVELEVRYSVDEGAEQGALVLLSRSWKTRDAKLLKDLQASLSVDECTPLSGSTAPLFGLISMMWLKMADGQEWRMRLLRWPVLLYIQDPYRPERSYKLRMRLPWDEWRKDPSAEPEFRTRLRAVLEEAEGGPVYLTKHPPKSSEAVAKWETPH